MPNLELLDRVIEQIEAHPDQWDQANWRCETGMCVAGWAAELSGATWAIKKPTSDYASVAMIVPAEEALYPWDDWKREQYELPALPDGMAYDSAAAQAERFLDLTDEQARALFEANNSLEDIKMIRKELAETHGSAEPNAS